MCDTKKVAILYSGGKNFGGIESYILNLVKNIDDSSIDIKVLSLGEWELTNRLRDFRIRPIIFSDNRINPLTIVKIGEYLQKNNFDLLVSQGVVSNAYARMISIGYKIPNLVTVHSTIDSDYKNPITKNIYKLIDFAGSFKTKKYIAVSEFIKSSLLKNKVKPNKIKVIYNGVDFDKPKPRQHRRLVVGSMGRLDQVKGFDILIKAFSLLDNKRLRLKIAGIGEELEQLSELAKALGVKNRVEFVGFQKNVNDFLDSIDVYVQPSRSEGFGIAVVEAMSRELPVVVTPVGSLGEIVDDKQTGIIAKKAEPKSVADALKFMVENYEESTKIGKNARLSVVERFDIKTWIQQTVDVYKEAVK